MSCSEDELPDLCVLLGMPKASGARPDHPNLRRSPRKKVTGDEDGAEGGKHRVVGLAGISRQNRQSPAKRLSPMKADEYTALKADPITSRLGNIPSLTWQAANVPATASSNNRSSPRHEPRPVGLLHVDSLLLPLSKLAMHDQQQQKTTKTTHRSARSKAQQSASRYVLSEARCNDEEEDSVPEEDEDEETDLSGFIVDDNADLSYSEWSETDSIPSRRKALSEAGSRPRLQRGSPRRSTQREQDTSVGLTSRRQIFGLGAVHNKGSASIEVIDLTTSPEKAPKQEPEAVESRPEHTATAVRETGLLGKFDELVRLPPPKFDLFSDVPRKQHNPDLSSQETNARGPADQDTFTTPPTTPPPLPSKLKSPSKLLSPSKKNAVHRSPHRQSTDAFWDLHTINSWHDQYSPKKAPVASPGKRGLARLQIWSDDSADESLEDTSSDSLPSPCLSPTKPRSPLKSPEKAERQRIAAEKKTAKSRKAAFDKSKEQLALDLLDELDKHITSSQLSSLCASSGGVKIVWSKTLRSTAGRANWRRTVTKPTDSPIKGNTIPSGPGVKVEHFANIELAAKVIDSQDRLVNTLAHEFCHLANFMVSNVRDQPHGASFKAWAKKVTSHLQRSDRELWRQVEVTTKHSYKIDHKYLWVCVGRERSKAAEFLNIAEDEGCGAEYGRHSKSIDTDKQRCGRCKGKLAQVRPKPRESPVKNRVGQGRVKRETGKAKGDVEVLEEMMEVVDLSD